MKYDYLIFGLTYSIISVFIIAIALFIFLVFISRHYADLDGDERAMKHIFYFIIIFFPPIHFIINYLAIMFNDFEIIKHDLNNGMTSIRLASIYLVYRFSILIFKLPIIFGVSEEEIDIDGGISKNILEKYIGNLYQLIIEQYFYYSLILFYLSLMMIMNESYIYTALIMTIFIFIFDDWNIIVDYMFLTKGKIIRDHMRKIIISNFMVLFIFIFYLVNKIVFNNLEASYYYSLIMLMLLSLILPFSIMKKFKKLNKIDVYKQSLK